MPAAGVPRHRTTIQPAATGLSARLLVLLLARNNAAHAALGIFHVAAIAWDDVDVDVRDRLSGSRADVDTDIIAVGFKLLVELPLHAVNQLPDSCLFRRGSVEIALYVAMRYHQAMTRTDRILVVTHERQLIFNYDSWFPAKRAIGMFVRFVQNTVSLWQTNDGAFARFTWPVLPAT